MIVVVARFDGIDQLGQAMSGDPGVPVLIPLISSDLESRRRTVTR